MDNDQLFGEIDLANAIDWRHPHNKGRAAWWLCLPGAMAGGRWLNLCGQNHGTLTNMAATASGWRGTTRPGGMGHMLFDGVDDRVASVQIPALTSKFTIAAWVNPSAVTSYRTIYADDIRGLFLNAGKIDWYQGGDNLGNTTLSAGSWRRIVMTYDGANVAYYLDGTLDRSFTFGAVPPTAASAGIGGHAAGDYFTGSLDDVVVWSRTLSVADVAADYNLSLLGYPGVLRRWPGLGAALMAPRVVAGNPASILLQLM